VGLHLEDFLEVAAEDLDSGGLVRVGDAGDEEAALERGHDLVVGGSFFVAAGFLCDGGRGFFLGYDGLDLADGLVGAGGVDDGFSVVSLGSINGNTVEI